MYRTFTLVPLTLGPHEPRTRTWHLRATGEAEGWGKGGSGLAVEGGLSDRRATRWLAGALAIFSGPRSRWARSGGLAVAAAREIRAKRPRSRNGADAATRAEWLPGQGNAVRFARGRVPALCLPRGYGLHGLLGRGERGRDDSPGRHAQQVKCVHSLQSVCWLSPRDERQDVRGVVRGRGPGFGWVGRT